MSKVYHYIIPDIPPSNNRFIGRNNRWNYQELKKQWAQLIAIYCRPKPKFPFPRSVVTLEYHFGDNRRRDPDNYSGKFILDGLKSSGIIEDDCFKCIDLQLKAVCDGEKETHIFVESRC
mgnify:CR=1 FL=1